MSTSGKTVVEHHLKDLPLLDDPREYAKKMGDDFWPIIKAIAAESREKDLYKNKSFFIVLIHKIDRATGIPEGRAFSRLSAPTPTYGQSVMKVHKDGGIELIWAIPQSAKYHEILRDKVRYLEDKKEKFRAQSVILMETGELLAWAKKENGEKVDAVISNKKEH